uniref:Uncharacterized protein n=1 Tax=Zea mays TaxID=4577 RepID=C4J7J5_MAIZE|nr:unknown [Zea mays]
MPWRSWPPLPTPSPRTPSPTPSPLRRLLRRRQLPLDKSAKWKQHMKSTWRRKMQLQST